MNVVILTRIRLGKMPEVRDFAGGNTKATFSVVQDTWSKAEKKEVPQWFRCTMWGEKVEAFVRHVVPGQQLSIKGRLQEEKWEKNGQKFTAHTVVVDHIELGEKPRGTRVEGSDPAPAAAGSAASPATQSSSPVPGIDFDFEDSPF